VPFESAWFALSKTDTEKPLSASVLVTETESANEFLAFLGKVFSDSATQASLTTELRNLVIAEDRTAAEQSERQQETTSANEADTKFAAAIGMLRTCSTAQSDLETAGANAVVAMRDANLKALIAGRSEPFPTVAIDLRAGPVGIKDACSKALATVAKP
jgi:hypothetical protein